MINNEVIGSRIKSRRLQLDLTLKELAEKIGVAPSTIQRYESGTFDRIKLPVILQIADALYVDPNWITGASDEINAFETNATNILPLPKTRKLPLLGDIACGTPILAQQNIQEYIEVPADIHADFVLRCHGDSMKDARILDGDVVYIHQQPTIENGEIAAVLIDEEATLKRVYITGDHVTLQPANPEYEPLVYFGESMADVHIMGKAVAFTSLVK